MNKLATLAFTAALAAALTLFGCKEEKAKTPEAAAPSPCASNQFDPRKPDGWSIDANCIDSNLIVSSKDYGIENFRLIMSMDDAKKYFPSKPRSEAKNNLGYSTLAFDEIVLVFYPENDNDISLYSIEATGKKYASPRGLRVGDDADKLFTLYGAPYYVRDNVWTYLDNGVGNEILHITVMDGVVKKIFLHGEGDSQTEPEETPEADDEYYRKLREKDGMYCQDEKLEEKNGMYYLNNKPFTGTAEFKSFIGVNGIITFEVKDGKKHGKYESGDGGENIVGYYKNGEKDGEWITSDPGSTIKEYYKDGKKHGEWRYETLDPDLDYKITSVKIEVWENDKLISAREEVPEANNLCRDNENVLLSFKMKNSSKLMSLCAEKSENYIAYRYGTKDNVELEYPENKTGSWDRFTVWVHKRSGEDETPGFQEEISFVSFENGGYEYVIRRDRYSAYEYEQYYITIKNKSTDKITRLDGDIETKSGGIWIYNKKIKSVIDDLRGG